MLQRKRKKDKKIKIPQFMIDNVTQFNNLQHEYNLNGTQ